ncbi:MAG: NADP-dependent phosphogluconate dehydrogenase [Polyangiaceae bacterium]|nr:NADP-dependent phosphogluconate dehydrogenase [Polyangiaceae bacterium]
MAEYAMGMVGLGVMGKNLSWNMEEKGFSVAAHDAWPDPVDRFVAESAGKNVAGFKDLGEFVRSLRRPRRIILLIKAGAVTDKGIAGLLPHLEPGDIVVDAGNEYFRETERRAKELAAKELRYFGMGVSGGEEGARHGPSMMPGGDKAAYEELAPVLTKTAAQVADGPCVTYIGPGGAGHYVKMVHNGIEYGDMQLIAEAYWLLKHLGGLSNQELHDTFAEWNTGELSSFLVEITRDIFATKDPEGPGELLDKVLDQGQMKGTGKWTVMDAAELGVAIPTIATSVEMRVLSSAKAARVHASKVLPGPPVGASKADKKQLIADVRAALYASKACSYAQGLGLIGKASDERGWGIQISELARIWQGGCIIRAQFLTRIKEAYQRDPRLANLLLDPGFVEELRSRQEGWRNVVSLATRVGLPVLTMGASLGYYDTVRAESLPVNLVQAQRDLFGAHTYKRVDREGDFHSKWR